MSFRWSEETTYKFVSKYLENECLWNIKSPQYKNKQIKESAYLDIEKSMNVPGFGEKEIKMKIKNIRSTYSQEIKKIKDSKSSGAGTDTVYIPSVKWFSLLNASLQNLTSTLTESESNLLQLAEARDVKFTQPLLEPLAIGSHIVCTGTPTDDIPWFALNIGSGEAELGHADIAVHFNVRLPQCYVVRNTRRHDKWGPEETTAFRLFPFKAGRMFTIEVLVEEKETLWAVDGEHYCTFAHRNPTPFTATWVQVAGVRDATLLVQKAEVYPFLAPPLVEVPLRTSMDAPSENEPSWRPNVMATLSNGVPEGHQVVVHGRLRPMLHSFAIDLMDAAREWPPANVHLHANVRAHDESQRTRQLVVLNAWLGSWGPENRQRTAKLVPGTMTTFRIVRSPSEWSVYADDMLIGELEYRAAPEGVKALRVRGDLYPEQIYVCPASTTPLSGS